MRVCKSRFVPYNDIMSTAFQKLFISITVIFLIFLLVYFFFMLSVVRRAAVLDVSNYLERRIQTSVDRANSAQTFTEEMLLSSPSGIDRRLRVLMLYREDAGIFELWTSSREYIQNLPQNLEQVSGTPNLSYNDIYEELLEFPLDGNRKLAVVFQALAPGDLNPILINILYFLIGFAVFTLLFLIIRLIAQGDEVDSGIEYHSVGPSDADTMRPDAAAQTSDHVEAAGSESSRPGKSEADHIEEELEMVEEPPQAGRSFDKRDNSSPGKPRFLPEENQIWPVDLIKLRLNNEIERSAENESDIAFAVFRLEKVFSKNHELLEKFEQSLLSFFRYEDLVFNLDKLYYGVILPNHGQEECIKQIEKFLVHCDESIPGDETVFAGYSTRSGRLMGGERLMKEGVKAATMSSPKKGRIIGFKPDPQKYRAHLMGAPR
jgi:hypothetical protein